MSLQWGRGNILEIPKKGYIKKCLIATLPEKKIVYVFYYRQRAYTRKGLSHAFHQLACIANDFLRTPKV